MAFLASPPQASSTAVTSASIQTALGYLRYAIVEGRKDKPISDVDAELVTASSST